jgi:hypothetical protein
MDEPIAFAKGFVYNRNLLYITAVSEELDEQDVYHAIVLRRLDGQWAHWTVDDRIVSLCAFDGPDGRTVMAMGIDGRIQVADSTGRHWETVDTGDESPSRLRHLSVMRRIGQHVYVAGMARQVYRRLLLGGPWERSDQGVLVPRQSMEIAGFNGIDGLSESDIYAAGFYGQVWHYDGAVWRQLDSLTNVRLQCVRCVGPNLVFVCGAKGTVLSGHRDRWSVIHNDVTDQPFWGMEYFKGSLYLATDHSAIFKVDGDRIVPVGLGFETDVTTNWLHANEEVLLSVGHGDLVLFDGEVWARIPHPGERRLV